MAEEKAGQIKAETHPGRRARENGHICAHCRTPLRAPREQSAKLCSWCEESACKPD